MGALCFSLQDHRVCIIRTRRAFARDGMFLTRYPPTLGIVSTIFLFELILGSGASAQTTPGLEAKTITLGTITQRNQKEVEARFQDFVSYIGRKLAAQTKIEGKVMIASTQPRLASLLRERRADFYMESPYPTYLINDVYDSGKLLLRRWKGGMADYRALILTRTEGDTKHLEDLRKDHCF